MTIGFDGIRTVDGDSPLSFYDRIVIASLGREYPKDTFMIYSPIGPSDSSISSLLSIANVHNKTPYKALNKWRWRNRSGIFVDFHRHGVKVFHGLDAILPTGTCHDDVKMVITLRDLSFKRMMTDYSWLEKLFRNSRIKQACHKAERVIATSEYIKDQAVKRYGIGADKVDVIHTAYRNEYITTEYDQDYLANVRSKYHLPRNFILAISDFSPLANMETLYRAFASIDNKDINLVVIGRRNDNYHRLKRLAQQLNIADRVVRVPFVSRHSFMAFYALSKAFIEPALQDGVGQCLVEAMITGTPVIASDDGCHREMGGDAALYFAAGDDQGLTRHINSVLSNDTVSQRMATAGKQQALQFSQQALAQATMLSYNRARGKVAE